MSFETCLLNYRFNILLNETRQRERVTSFILLHQTSIVCDLQLINKSRSIFLYSYFCTMF